MSVSGDMVTMAAKHLDCSRESATDFLRAILEDAKDPNFASVFAREEGDDENDGMLNYWAVIDFLIRKL